MTEDDRGDDAGRDSYPAEATGDDEPVIDQPWPWSFILLVVAGALYLIFRFVELAIKIFT